VIPEIFPDRRLTTGAIADSITIMDNETTIREFLSGKDTLAPAMVARWIAGGLTSQLGKFFALNPRRMRVSGTPTGKMRFTCQVDLTVFSGERSQDCKGKYVWTLNKRGEYRGKVTAL
jgi:hypothetical protein